MTEQQKNKIYPAKLFHDQMIAYMEEYAAYLLLVKSDPAVISKRVVLQQFINYLFNEHLVANLNEISQEMLDYGNLPKDEYPDLTSKTPSGLILDTLRGFFEFLDGKYDQANDVLTILTKNDSGLD